MAYTNTVTVAQKYTLFAPFFQVTRSETSDKRVDYSCIFCNKPVEPKTVGGRSFTGTAIVWTHVECLSAVPGAALSTDKVAKNRAHKALLERQIVARKAEREAKAPETAHVCPTVDEAALRATIEAEYDAVMARALECITSQDARIEALTQELAAYKAAVITGITPAPAPAIEDATTAAVVAAMSNPANETTIDVAQEETAPKPAPSTPTVETWGTERPVIGTHVGIYDGANNDQSIIRISGKKFQNPATLKGYGYFTTSASKAALVSLKPGASVQITVEGKYVTAIMPAPVSTTEAAKTASKARRNAKRTSAA